MPKKPRKEGALTIIRKGLGLSQSEFGRQLGVSASMIKKLEEGKRALSQDVQARVYAETGVMLVNGGVLDETFTYSKKEHTEWLAETQLNQQTAQYMTRMLARLIELMLTSASRPGVQKSFQVFNALLQALENTKNEFHLEKNIEAELRERQATETKRYKVRDLRGNDLLAKMVGFKDDPKLKDDDTLPLEKTVGWFPAKELFNVVWQHREFLKELLATSEETLTDETKSQLGSRLEAIENQVDSEMSTFFKRQGLP